MAFAASAEVGAGGALGFRGDLFQDPVAARVGDSFRDFAFLFWVVWKFYDILARMNENLSSIRRVLERSGN